MFFVFGQSVSAQKDGENLVLKKAELINEGNYSNSETASSDIDMVRAVMRKNPNSRAVFVIYCGKICRYGEVEAHIKGINLALEGKGWKKSEFAVINGGYRESFWIEYWIIPEGDCLPVPVSRVEIKDVKFNGTYRRKFVPYDCCGY